MSEQFLDKLSGINIFSNLELINLEKIEKVFRFKHYAAQEQVIDRQSNSTDIYFIINGSVRVVNYSISGRVVSFADLSAGNYFGELSALDGQPRSASVLALTDSLLASMPQEQFLFLLEEHFPVALKVMQSLAQVVRNSTIRIMDLSTLAANNRIQAELLRLAKDKLTDDNVAKISPIPVHSDIASRVSTSRETVARVFMKLARRGIIERQKKALVVKNVKQLSNMVEKVRGE